MLEKFLLACVIIISSPTISHSADLNQDSLIAILKNQSGNTRLKTLLLLSKQLSYSDQRASIGYANVAINLANELHDMSSSSSAYCNLGDAYYYLNDLESAKANYELALKVANKAGNKELQANAINNIGIVHYLWGNLDEAEKTFGRAMENYAAIHDDQGEANCLNNLANIHFDKGDVDKAVSFYEKVLDIKKKSSNTKDYVNAMANIGNVFERRGRYDEALKYYDNALGIIKRNGDKRIIASISSNIGAIYMNKGNIAKAVSYYNMALSLSEEVGDQKSVAMILTNLSLLNISQGNFKKAHDLLQRALRLHKGQADKAGISKDLYNLGVIFEELKEFGNAVDYYNEALAIMQQLDDKKGVANVFLGLGNSFSNLKDYDKAFRYYNDALQIKQQLADDQGIAKIFQNMGALYEITGKDNEAIAYYEKSLKLEQETGNVNGITESLINIGTIYKNRGNFSKASEYYKRCEELARKNNYKKLLMVISKHFSEIYMLQDNYSKALDYYIDYTALKDSIFNEEAKRQISEMQTRYEAEKSKQQIMLLKKEGALRDVEIRQKRLWTNALAVFIILIVVFFMYLYRIKTRANKLLADKNAKIQQHQNEIIDSINYASKIQSALLPQKESIGKVLHEYFVLYKPRDIVSGDFYWLSNINECVYVCAADCTGHGVPGAFMSMLGISLLNEAVNRKHISNTGQILDYMRCEIINSLHQESDLSIKDGMDLSLFCIDLQNMRLQFSGAFNNLIVIRNKCLVELKADSMPIAFYLHMNNFKNQTFDLLKNDMIYAFSDGYVDQFGGPNNKKFMKKRFKEMLISIAHLPVAEQREILDRTIVEWRGGNDQTDDISVFGVKIC